MTAAPPGTLLPGGRIQIAVIGPGSCTVREYGSARAAGRLIAREGAALLCGGLGRTMEAACRGAWKNRVSDIQTLPDSGQGNPYPAMVIQPCLGHARSGALVQSADIVPAFCGSHANPFGDGTCLEVQEGRVLVPYLEDRGDLPG